MKQTGSVQASALGGEPGIIFLHRHWHQLSVFLAFLLGMYNIMIGRPLRLLLGLFRLVVRRSSSHSAFVRKVCTALAAPGEGLPKAGYEILRLQLGLLSLLSRKAS